MDIKKNVIKIFLVILCLFAVGFFAMVQSGTEMPLVQTYKNNFKRNVSGICRILKIDVPLEMQFYLNDMSTPAPAPTMIPADEQREMDEALGYPVSDEEEIVPHEGTVALTTKEPIKSNAKKENQPIAFDAAENSKFAVYKNYIVCANETNYIAYDAGGNLVWKQKLQMQNPILKVSGDYVLLAETGAKKLSLYKGKKLIFGTKTAGNIITASVSKNGDVVAVTEKEFYKGQVVVYNKKGERIFAWDSGSYNILDAVISPHRKVAVSMLNTDSGADSFITCFGVDGKERYKTENFSGMIIFALEYNGENLTAFSDTKCMGISQKGKTTWEYDYGGKNIEHYTVAENGNKLLLFDNDNTGELLGIAGSGKTCEPIKAESMPDCIDIKLDYVAYNNGRDVIVMSMNAKTALTASCSSDIKQLHILDSKHVLAVYSSSIQFKKLLKTVNTDNKARTEASATPVASPEPSGNPKEGEK
ncbi:MAG: DUF5711 family protein [Firmicutes bacterium]|nr:DUF5711 family protein [Bacillota bacterium]